ncbi:CPA_1a_G0027970.mRNA.1.CDS.1 [Saccharomyces cerevisiae]|nr:CPA_1a_G0027970.mRNA.1.CDS.1 [Saccharomyces cerevisiae]CAI7250672.1 CPA_1a_G0027970.mRNA.1.CDS.1 [Saccharomyces cerevisiae]
MAYAHGCYSIYHSQVTLLSHSNPWLISLTKSVPNALASLCTALASAVYTLCHLRITPNDYPHFNIYISFGGPKYCITALNTYVIPLLHRILTTQFIYTYANITKKITTKIT